MTQLREDATPAAADVHHLPPQTRRPPHVLCIEINVPAAQSVSGHAQKEKTCKNCGAVRVTIFGVEASEARAWRRSADGVQIVTTLEPPCDVDAGWPV